MGGEENELWVNEAMKDDSMVVELLIGLKHSESAAAAKISVPPISTPFEWGVRLPRSRPIIRCSNNNLLIKKEGESSTRASPTTPLSWSGGTSLSGGGVFVGGGATTCGGGGDGYEDSSKPVVKRQTAAAASSGRSKGNGTNEPTNRRSRKKTFAELKESEILLLKEKIQLNRDIATLQITYEERKAKNIQLKKMKLDSQLQPAKQITLADVKERLGNLSRNRDETAETPSSLSIVGTLTNPDEPAPAPAVCPSTLPTDPHTEQRDIQNRNSLFGIPDLNLPVEDDSGSEVFNTLTCCSSSLS